MSEGEQRYYVHSDRTFITDQENRTMFALTAKANDFPEPLVDTPEEFTPVYETYIDDGPVINGDGISVEWFQLDTEIVEPDGEQGFGNDSSCEQRWHSSGPAYEERSRGDGYEEEPPFDQEEDSEFWNDDGPNP